MCAEEFSWFNGHAAKHSSVEEYRKIDPVSTFIGKDDDEKLQGQLDLSTFALELFHAELGRILDLSNRNPPEDYYAQSDPKIKGAVFHIRDAFGNTFFQLEIDITDICTCSGTFFNPFDGQEYQQTGIRIIYRWHPPQWPNDGFWMYLTSYPSGLGTCDGRTCRFSDIKGAGQSGRFLIEPNPFPPPLPRTTPWRTYFWIKRRIQQPNALKS